MTTVSRTWNDPVANLDLAAAQKVSEANWDMAMSDIAYIGNAIEPTTFTNKSGGALSAGAVVVIDTANAASFTTTILQSNPRVLGVVVDSSIASNGTGRVATLGPVATVNVQGNVAIGDFLECSTTAGRARSNGGTKTPGTFAVATSLYSGGAAGTVSAMLLNGGSAIGQFVIRKAAQTQVKNNNTTLADDDTLLFPIAANEISEYRWVLWVTTNSAADFKLAVTSPAGSSIKYKALGYGAGTAMQSQRANASGAAISLNTGGTTLEVEVEARVTNGVTPGNVTLQWAQDTATAVDTLVETSSTLKITKIG